MELKCIKFFYFITISEFNFLSKDVRGSASAHGKIHDVLVVILTAF